MAGAERDGVSVQKTGGQTRDGRQQFRKTSRSRVKAEMKQVCGIEGFRGKK